MNFPEAVLARAARIALVSFDVDGVLTDGRLLYTARGEAIKAFHVQDGAAIKLLLDRGVGVALISGRRSAMVERRAAELGIRHVLQGVDDKVAALDTLCARLGLEPRATAHVGDDLPDLPLLRHAGLAITVRNGHPGLLPHVHYCTTLAGGEGVAREVAELVLRARGLWEYDP
jgi:3-deoxy-D-manno-octulosonate 8-phosphate phosphatase (KDO 8-P phosphatase)